MFRIVSDIHLEHWCYGAFTKQDIAVHMSKALPPGPADKDTTLILAGDISQHHIQRKWMLEAVSPRFKKIVYVAGNHEHWANRLTDWNGEAQNFEADFANVYVGQTNEACRTNIGTEEAPLDVIYATMWAPYGKDNPVYEAALTCNADCSRIMADWTLRQCNPKDFQDMHTTELEWIKTALIESHRQGVNTAVVTHHVPSLKLRLPGLGPDPFDDMFMSPHAECFMHEDWAPKFWFFGHTHKAWDIQIGKTRCVSNPFGYPGERYMGWISNKTV